MRHRCNTNLGRGYWSKQVEKKITMSVRGSEKSQKCSNRTTNTLLCLWWGSRPVPAGECCLVWNELGCGGPTLLFPFVWFLFTGINGFVQLTFGWTDTCARCLWLHDIIFRVLHIVKCRSNFGIYHKTSGANVDIPLETSRTLWTKGAMKGFVSCWIGLTQKDPSCLETNQTPLFSLYSWRRRSVDSGRCGLRQKRGNWRTERLSRSRARPSLCRLQTPLTLMDNVSHFLTAV